MATRNFSLRLKLRPDLAEGFSDHAAVFGLAASTLLAVLVWNDSIRPDRSLVALPRAPKLARAPLTCSLRKRHRALAATRSREQDMSLNAYLEALIAKSAKRPSGPLIVLDSP